MIEKYKPNTGYNWERMDETIMNIEREFHSEDPEPNSDDLESVLEESAGVNDKDLPKRVLAFTTKNLLEELEQNRKTSVMAPSNLPVHFGVSSLSG